MYDVLGLLLLILTGLFFLAIPVALSFGLVWLYAKIKHYRRAETIRS